LIKKLKPEETQKQIADETDNNLIKSQVSYIQKAKK
jgi:hypothetical protein